VEGSDFANQGQGALDDESNSDDSGSSDGSTSGSGI
jgi:hypothetical protein